MVLDAKGTRVHCLGRHGLGRGGRGASPRVQSWHKSAPGTSEAG